MEDNKPKGLKSRLNANREGASTLVAPPGSAPLVGPPGSAPLVAPPGVPVATAPVQPTPVYEEPIRPSKKKEGPVVIRGEIDEATAAEAGIKKGGGKLLQVVTTVVPFLFFGYVGSVAGDLYFRGKVEALSQKEKKELWEKVSSQELPAKNLVESLKKNVEQKDNVDQVLSQLTPELAIKKNDDLLAGVKTTDFFPADGLFLPTTPFIDNGKKDTDIRYMGALLDYQEALSIFLVQVRLHAEATKRDKDRLTAGLDVVRRRASEDPPIEIKTDPQTKQKAQVLSPDPRIISAAVNIAKYTQAPFKGYALELLENNQAKLVIVYDTEMTDSPNGEPQVSSYKIYDFELGATAPTDEKLFRVLDKTKVAVLDPRNTRTFLLSRDTTPVEGYFLRTFYMVKAASQIYAGSTSAKDSLQKAYTGETLTPEEPKKKEATPSGEAPAAPGAPATPAPAAPAAATPATPAAPTK